MKRLVTLLLSLTVTSVSNAESLQEFAKANSLFASAVYKEITKNNSKNFLVSPYSAEVVLAFAHAGCKGDTAKEIRNSLFLPDDNDKIESAVKASISALTGNQLYTLHTANKMYVKQAFQIKDSFKRSAVEVFGADIEPIDFTRNVEAANTMNKWVEEKTNDKIRNLIDPNILDGDTRSVLINALYFKANWSNQFWERSTRKENFFETSQNVVEVDMMHHYQKTFNYYESQELNAKFLEMPFVGGDVSMVVVLPNEKEGLATLEKQIDKVLAPQHLKSEYVNVALPKFKIESTIRLVEVLKNLGIRKAFDDRLADLSGIAGEPGDLYVSDVLQKTYIDVLEGGIEAAAATYVAVSVPVSAINVYPVIEPKNFVADHPFMFYIKAKDIIIFAGRVLSPNP